MLYSIFRPDDCETIKALPSPTDEAFAEPRALNLDAHTSKSKQNTPNLSVDSRTNERFSTFYVPLPGEDGNQYGEGFSRTANISESNDEFSDISDLGKGAHFDLESEFSQISDTNWANQQVSFPSSIDNTSINSLRVFVEQPDSNFTQKKIPDIRQPNFSALWQTLGEIVGCANHELWRARKSQNTTNQTSQI